MHDRPEGEMNDLRNYTFRKLPYPVIFGNEIWPGLSSQWNAMIGSGKLFILTDKNTHKLCLPHLTEKLPSLIWKSVFTLPPGEGSKQSESLVNIWNWLLEEGAERHDVLLNLGGGVVSDLGGFAAGTYKRGIRFINVPTSLTGQGDAAIGGKTGINLSGVKNATGLFNDPVAVIIDPTFLNTLPERHFKAGLAELIKCAFLSGGEFWRYARNPGALNKDSISELIYKAVSFKMDVVGQDPLENSFRKILNFGHTIGHAIEGNRPDTWLHGEAVAAGMICEAYLSHRISGLAKTEMDELIGVILRTLDLQTFDTNQAGEILELIRYDKKMKDGSSGFILMKRIGEPRINQNAGPDQIIESLEFYNRILTDRAHYLES